MDSLYIAVLRKKSPIQLGDYAYLEAEYEAASLQQGGRVIKPPRYVWRIYEGVHANSQIESVEIASEQAKEALIFGLKSNQSFELPPLGMFYKKEKGFELLLSTKSAYRSGPNYGLPSLNLQPIKSTIQPTVSDTPDTKGKKQLWVLQVAAVVLFVVLLNVLALLYLSENGGLSFKQLSKVSLFDSLREPNSFEYAEESLENEVFSAQEEVELPLPADSKVMQALVQQPIDSAVKVEPEETTKKETVSEKVPDAPTKPIESVVQGTNQQKNSVSVGQGVQVVVGAFSSASNAESMVKDLKNKGWQASILSRPADKWHRVVLSPGAGNTSNESFLEEVRSNIHPQAWILAQ